MKKILLNNLSLKILAFILGIFLWIAVMYNLNPIITKDFQIKVHIINEEVLTEKGWKYTIDGSDEVKVTVKAQSLEMAKIDEDDIYLYVDMRYLNVGSGTERQGGIQYNLKNNSIESISLSRDIMLFNLEEIVSRDFKVDVQLTGDVAENYTTNENPTAVPEYVTITGPLSQVEQVTKVVYYLTIDDASEDIDIVAKPIMIGADGEELDELQNVTMTPEYVEICLPIYQTKTVPIECEEFVGEPATGYGLSNIILDTESVKIAGYKAILANIVSIKIPPELINIEGIASNQTFTINIDELELPEGVSLIGNDHIVNVTIKIEKKKQNNFRIQLPEDITIENKIDDYSYSFVENSIYITVEGVSDVLSSLESANIISSINVADLVPSDEAYTLPLSVILPDDISLVTPVSVKVLIEQNIEPTEPTSQVVPSTSQQETSSEEPTPEETEADETTETEEITEEETTEEVTTEETQEVIIITLPETSEIEEIEE